MTVADRIYEQVKRLPEDKVRRVLDFVVMLNTLNAPQAPAIADFNDDAAADWEEFEKAAGSWSGKFVRDDCYEQDVE